MNAEAVNVILLITTSASSALAVGVVWKHYGSQIVERVPSIAAEMKKLMPERSPTLTVKDFGVMSRSVQYDGQVQNDRRYQ